MAENTIRLRRTEMMGEIEKEMHLSLPKWLRDRYYAGLSYTEMAEQLGCSASTIGRWMRLMGYNYYGAAHLAYEHDLLPTVVLENRPRVQPARNGGQPSGESMGLEDMK